MSKADATAKKAIADWGAATSSLFGEGKWLQMRPSSGNRAPKLRMPGSKKGSSQPDGLFGRIAATEYDESTFYFADIVVVEACGSLPNLGDKRSRYSHSTASLTLELREDWLVKFHKTRGRGGGQRPNYEYLGLPAETARIPIRYMSVLYCLDDNLYEENKLSIVPNGHEFFMPYSSMRSSSSPQFKRFAARFHISQHFYRKNSSHAL
jgi:hypothetical protein